MSLAVSLVAAFEEKTDCRFGVHASGAGSCGFESHRRKLASRHRAVAQWQSAVKLWSQLRRSPKQSPDCRFGVHQEPVASNARVGATPTRSRLRTGGGIVDAQELSLATTSSGDQQNNTRLPCGVHGLAGSNPARRPGAGSMAPDLVGRSASSKEYALRNTSSSVLEHVTSPTDRAEYIHHARQGTGNSQCSGLALAKPNGTAALSQPSLVWSRY